MRTAGFALAAVLAASPAMAQTLSLLGEAGQAATFSAAQLAALPHVHVQVLQHGHPHAFDGVLLSDLLAKVGAPQGEANKTYRVSCGDGAVHT